MSSSARSQNPVPSSSAPQILDRRTFMHWTVAVAGASLAGCGGSASSDDSDGSVRPSPVSPPPLPVGVAATFVVTRQTVANSIALGSGFAGFSYEKKHLVVPLPAFFSAQNTDLIGLFNALGPGVLRIGGNSVDINTWTPDGAGQIVGQIAKIDAANLAAFMKQCPGWTVLYGINYAGGAGSSASPELAAAEAAFVAQELGAQLLGFEIGNEPNDYGTGNTPNLAGITYDIFLNGGTVSQGVIAGWNDFARAIEAAAPGVPLTGLAASGSGTWTRNFAADQPGAVALLTEHYYKQTDPSIVAMLTYPDTALTAKLQLLLASSQQSGTPFRFDEVNSFVGSKNPAGVSDTFASALWGIDFIFTHALNGSSGLNFHGGGTAPYTPIGGASSAVTAVQPLFYGIMFFSQIFAGGATGRLLGSTLTADGVALSAFAVEAGGATYVVLNNKDIANAANVTIAIGEDAVQAVSLSLASSGDDANAQLSNLGIYNNGSPITLGGGAIGLDGAWNGQWSAPVPVIGQSVTLNVAAASALLVRID